jgi:DNA gyrase subunit A
VLLRGKIGETYCVGGMTDEISNLDVVKLMLKLMGKDEDMIDHIRFAMTHDNILFFSNKGKVYQLRAFEIAESSRVAKGSAIINLLNIEAGEKVESFVAYRPDAAKTGFVFLTTRNGTVKKSKLSEFANIRRGGMIAIKLEKGDELVWSNFTTGQNDILIITKQGKAIKFKEEEVRHTGRDTMGVRGIKQMVGDEVIGMDVIERKDNAALLTIMQNGLGKKTEVKQFPLQSRGGQGVKVAKVTDKTGEVAVAQVIPPNGEEVIMTSLRGQVVKLALNQIPKLSRDTQGVILMRFSNQSDKVASATCIEKS